MADTIRHHLSDDLLMAYSADALPEALNLMVATHVSLCDTCRAQLESYDALGGALLDDADEVEMETSALDAILARLDDVTEEEPRPIIVGDVLPAPLRDYVGGGIDAVKWRPVGMGVKQAILPTSKEASARLLYIPAGVAVPDHGHRGMELTIVLQGAFSDDFDRFGPGDVEAADEDIEHTPTAEAGQDCICLAVTDAPLRFNGLIPRILQPFLRI